MPAKSFFPLSSLLGLLFSITTLPAADLPASVKDIHAPVWVGRPPSDAFSGLVQLENGELRHYDWGFDPTPEIHHHPGFLPTSYIFSRDHGLTWQSQPVPKGHLGADCRSPLSGEYLRLQAEPDGMYVLKSKGGIDGEWKMQRVWDIPIRGSELNLTRSIVYIRGGKRAISAWSSMRGRFPGLADNSVGTLYSDDDGETWQHSNLITAPAHEPNARDKSVRWQNGAYEPSVVELRDGRLWMLLRTSLDYHYQSFSSDGGATWSPPTPSPFYATLTDPTIGRLKDGRLLFLWNNTLPLPEFAKNESTAPFILQSAADGTGEDVFTNRDALHGAISDDDGKTWHGFREVLLDSNRNDSHYGDTGGMDRSVHQPQFVEVEGGRVVVATGQHWLHRSIFIFDPDWLLETKRRCDFSNGLDDWSVHGYFKGLRGHCAFNRYESSTLVPAPDDRQRRVLRVNTTSRRDAIFPRGGAVWNFPAGQAGYIEAQVRLGGKFGGARLALLDRWVNPVDPTVPDLAMGQVEIAPDGALSSGGKLRSGEWHTVRLTWPGDTAGASCAVGIDGQPAGTTQIARPAHHGISYVHIQSTSSEPDEGLLIRAIEAEVK